MIRYARQLGAYVAFAVFIVWFANGPAFQVLKPQEAMVSLTFSHAGQRIGECRTLSQDELNTLAPNMRKPNDCPRERHPVRIRLTANDDLLLEETLLPSGIWRDGKSNVYLRMTVTSGEYQFLVAMNDSGSDNGFDVEEVATVSVAAGQNLVISYDELRETFTFN